MAYTDAEINAAREWAVGKTGAEIAERANAFGLSAAEVGNIMGTSADAITSTGYGTSGGLKSDFAGATWGGYTAPSLAPAPAPAPAATSMTGTSTSGAVADTTQRDYMGRVMSPEFISSAKDWTIGKTLSETLAKASELGLTAEQVGQILGVSGSDVTEYTGYGQGASGIRADGTLDWQWGWNSDPTKASNGQHYANAWRVNGDRSQATPYGSVSLDSLVIGRDGVISNEPNVSVNGLLLNPYQGGTPRIPATATGLPATTGTYPAGGNPAATGAYTADGLRNAPQQSAQQPSNVLNSLEKLVENGRVTGQTAQLYAAMKADNPAYNDLVSWLWMKADPATGMVDLGGGSVLQAFDPAQMNGAQQSAGASSQSYRGMPSTGLNLQQIQQAQQLAVQPNQTVQGQLQQIIATDSPLMQQARARAMQTANARGMLNSSMAASAGESAMYDAAMPIAQQDAGTYADAAKFNVGEQNTFNRDANAFTRDAFMADFNLQANEWAKQQDQYRLYDQMGYQQRLTLDRDAIQNGYTNARDAILNGYTVARDATTNAFTLTRDAAQNTYQTDRDKTLQGYTKENNADQNAFTAGQQTSQNAFTLQRDNNQNAFTAGQQTSQNAFTSGQQAAQNTYSAEQAEKDRIAAYQRALLGVNTPATDTSLQRTQLSEAGATERTRLQIEANAAERAANTRLDAQTNLNKITTEWAGKVIAINTSDLSQPQKDAALIQYTSTYEPIAISYATQAGLDPTNVGKDLRYVAPAATNVVTTVSGGSGAQTSSSDNFA